MDAADDGAKTVANSEACAACTKPNAPAACPANPGSVSFCQSGAMCCAGAQLWSCLCLAETCTFHECGKL